MSRRRSSTATGKWLLAALLALATLYTLYFAAGLLIPVFLAIFLSMLMFPLVDLGSKLGVPAPATATLAMLALFTLIGIAVSTLAEPAEAWLEQAPESLRQLQEMSRSTQSSLDDLRDLAAQVTEMAEVDGPAAPQEVLVREPGLLESALVSLPTLMTKTVVVLLLALFLIMGGRSWLLKTICLGETLGERRRIVQVAQSVRLEISRYLVTVTLINGALGTATATFLWAMDVPNPVMWGVIVALLNYAPYAGALVSTVLLSIVGFSHEATLAGALLIPAGFLALTVLEGQLITPAVLGARMSISPAIVLLSVVVGGWMWDIAGALMAVPIMVSIKTVSDHYDPLLPLAILLARDGDMAAIQRLRQSQGIPARRQD